MVDEFDALFVDTAQLDKNLLQEILSSRVKLSAEGRIFYELDFNPMRKIVLYLLANKIFVMRKIKSEEAEGPLKISQNAGIAEGTVKAYVRDLEERGLIIGDKDGKYMVANSLLPRIKKFIIES
ncbi:MAG TPA: hypothetical protein HA224_00740 [Nanoarchaeota archaeon]|nr:hypothetical protein [Nanoarchaeota archaeon]